MVQTLRNAGHAAEVKVVAHFSSGYRSRNGGGDHIETDGALPFVTLKTESRAIDRPAKSS